MILVFGSINVDLVARVASIPRPGETVLTAGYAQYFGGKGANQAVAAARVLPPRQVAMAGRIGDDAFGRAALDDLANEGLDVSLVGLAPEPTCCAFIVVDARGENAITVASGANGVLRDDAVPADRLGRETTLVLQMEVPFDASLSMARRTRAAGGRVIWNVAPVPVGMTAAMVADVVATTDILIVNEHEALAMAAAAGWPAADHASAGVALSRAGCLTIVTAGAAGAVAYRPDGGRVAAMAVAIMPVDTTGAGDTFVGLLAAKLCDGGSLETALQLACRGASLSCLAPGARGGMPDRVALGWRQGGSD